MDANEIYFASRDLAAQWVAAASASIAAIAATAAGIFAARAWSSQVRQEKAVMKQLDLALDERQEGREEAEREDRRLSPHFKAVRLGLSAENQVMLECNTMVTSQKDLLYSDSISMIDLGKPLGSEVRFCILLGSDPDIPLRGWEVEVACSTSALMRAATWTQPPTSQFTNKWLLEFPHKDLPDQGTDVSFRFETMDGHVSTHLYHLALKRAGAREIVLLERLKPSGVFSRNGYRMGEAAARQRADS